jgi:predicted phosphoribosyltransferase
MVAPFRDRRHAGAALAEALRDHAGRDDLVVLGLPRGGVPVGYEVARRLGAPLDVFVVRKLGVPGHEELAMGAIASGGVMVIDERTRAWAGVGDAGLERVIARERRELARREQAFRGARPPVEIAGKTVILVDDGLATGASMRAAIQGLRARGPGQLVVGVPVAAPATCREIGAVVDDIVCVARPEPMHAVGLWYDDFSPTTDDEVRDLLELARGERSLPCSDPPPA